MDNLEFKDYHYFAEENPTRVRITNTKALICFLTHDTL